MWFSPNRIVRPEKPPYFRVWVFQITKNQHLFLARFNTSRDEAFSEPFAAEIAFFYHPSLSGGKFFIDFFDEGPGVPPVQAS
jgi:hypothetical protein